MANIEKEIQSLRDFIGSVLPPNIKYRILNMPSTYKSGEMVIESEDSQVNSETGNHFRVERVFQLVYFGESKLECIKIMQTLQEAFMRQQSLLVEEEGRMTLGVFGYGKAFKTETANVYAIVGMLPTVIREVIGQPKVEKINAVHIDVMSRDEARSWQAASKLQFQQVEDYTYKEVNSGAMGWSKREKKEDD